MRSVPEPRNIARGTLKFAALTPAIRHFSLHIICFGSFLGVSGSMVCVCEKVRRGRSDPINFLLGGAVGGLAFYPMLRSQKALVYTCAFTGIISAVTQEASVF